MPVVPGQWAARMPELRVAARSTATPQQLWDAITDWPGQSSWIPLTRTRLVAGLERAGARLEAFTGVGPLGFTDPMVVQVWEPPHRLVLAHQGRVVRGRAGFEITADGTGSRLLWWEEIDPPLGVVGRRLWPIGSPLAKALLGRSVRKVAAIAARETLADLSVPSSRVRPWT